MNIDRKVISAIASPHAFGRHEKSFLHLCINVEINILSVGCYVTVVFLCIEWRALSIRLRLGSIAAYKSARVGGSQGHGSSNNASGCLGERTVSRNVGMTGREGMCMSGQAWRRSSIIIPGRSTHGR